MYWRRARRAPISRELRHRVFDRDGYRCTKCGDDRAALLDVDHTWPVAMGGGSRLSNLRTLCRACNQRKGSGVTMAALLERHPELRMEDIRTEAEVADKAFGVTDATAWLADDMVPVFVPEEHAAAVRDFVAALRGAAPQINGLHGVLFSAPPPPTE
jgi:hypothetical protein